jgi:exopolyphosphatase / guanosine-5'-triphosphate,3'-diphosphate pyrophosphatase
MAPRNRDAAVRLDTELRSHRSFALLRGGNDPARSEPPRDAAVLDLGSSSWRLVVYRYVPGAWWRRTGQLQEPALIARGLDASGRLSRRAIQSGIDTLEIFARYCHARGIAPRDVHVVATSAVRDAANGDELVVRAAAATGFDVRVLSIEHEAHYGYLAAVNSTTLTDGVVLDVGGGSLQLVAVDEREPVAVGSWPLGAVRVTERLLPGDGPASRKLLKQARAAVRAELSRAPWLAASGSRLVAVAGAARNLAGAVQRAHGLDATGVQGYVLAHDDLRALVATLARLPRSARALPGIKPARADHILAAALVIEAVLELGGFDGIEVTRAGLREGVFFEHLLLAPGSPLIDGVREASIRGLAASCEADLAHAEHVAHIASQLHDSLARGGLIAPGREERELLWAAAMLHDIGMAIAYDGHHAHSHYLIVNAGLAGFHPREVALIAQIVRYHRKGMPDLDELERYARAGDRELVRRCAVILRLAEQLERGHGQSIRDARLVPSGRTVELHLDGDDDLARWSVGRRLGDDDTFRRVFGRRLTLA